MIFVFISIMILTAKDIEVKRDNTALRKGPASYYEILMKIPSRTYVKEIKALEGWIQVNYKSTPGYISSSATEEKKLKNDPFSGVTVKPGNIKATDHTVSAGVKGFARQFGTYQEFIPDPDFLESATQYLMDPQSFAVFESRTYTGYDRRKYINAYTLPVNDLPDYFTEAQEGFGLALAALISSSGLYNDSGLNNWVRNIGQVLVNAGYPSDITYRFFILDIDAPNAYACPGGFIFITRGMLDIIQSDAELAFILAHEVAHVCRFHGLMEMKERENQIGAESVFAELDEELPDAFDEEAKKTEAEMEAEITDIFSQLINGRLQKYEQEADKLGLIFMARAGFDPKAAKTILTRINSTSYTPANEHYTKNNITERLGWLANELKQYTKPKTEWLKPQKSTDRY
jgi:hypothetical protein